MRIRQCQRVRAGILILAMVFSLELQAGEPDNFSARQEGKSARFANEVINNAVNAVLDRALAEQKTDGGDLCRSDRFLKTLDDDLDRNFPLISQSIEVYAPVAGPYSYKEVPYQAGRPYTELYFSTSHLVRAQGREFYIGADKIDHFFSHGSLYWDVVGRDPKLPPEKVKRALELGVLQEQATWGLHKSRVKSYGDLSANFQGLYFWRDLLDGQPPLLICQKGRFIKNRDFDIANYFVPAMDESINCNSYADQKILTAITSVTQKWGQKCPAVPKLCEEARKKYGEWAPFLLHPRCLGEAQASQLEKPNPKTVKDVFDTVEGAISGGPQYLLFKFFKPTTKKEGVR